MYICVCIYNSQSLTDAIAGNIKHFSTLLKGALAPVGWWWWWCVCEWLAPPHPHPLFTAPPSLQITRASSNTAASCAAKTAP